MSYLFTQLQGSFYLVQARFPLSFISEPPTNGWEHLCLPGFYQQGIVVLLRINMDSDLLYTQVNTVILS